MIEDPVAIGLKSGWQVTDASTQKEDLTIEADAVIIGSGAGGGMAAEVLTQAGFSVVIVEEGPLKSSQDFKMKESEAYPELYQESAARKTADKAINILQGRCVGGGTTVNWTSSFSTPEPTLRYWAEQFGVKASLPEDMHPWFKRVQERLNITEWHIPPNANNALLGKGIEALGYSFNIMHRNVKNCANLGYCGVGCPVNAKQSMLVTTIPQALSAGATLLTRARAERLLFSGDEVTQVEIAALDSRGVRPTGKTITIRSKQIVMSGGAIGTPALLLRSNAPDPYRLVGKRTFLHPVNVVACIMPERVDGFAGAPQTIYSDAFLWPEGATGKMGYKLEVPPLHPLLVSTVIDSFGPAHRLLMQQLPYLQAILALHRDGFHPESEGGTVKLREDRSPFLDYPISDYVWEAMRRSFLTMSEIQFAAGARQVLPLHRAFDKPFNSWRETQAALKKVTLEPLAARLFSAHVMGGCNFGENPETSMVNSLGQHHHLKNVTVLDGSVFPTSIGSNPQVSIYAFSMRNALALAQRMGTSVSS